MDLSTVSHVTRETIDSRVDLSTARRLGPHVVPNFVTADHKAFYTVENERLEVK
jgi:hypothetical protein